MGQFGMEEALGADPVMSLLKEGSVVSPSSSGCCIIVWSDKFTPVCSSSPH